jgi:hypothetical protein
MLLKGEIRESSNMQSNVGTHPHPPLSQRDGFAKNEKG